MKRAHQTLRILSGVVVFILFTGCAILFFLLTNFDAPSFAQGSTRAGKLIVALEKHRQGWGKHPKELTQLIPDFLTELPRPGWRFEYQYTVCDRGVGYILYFETGNEGYCGFISKQAKWECVFPDSGPVDWSTSPCL